MTDDALLPTKPPAYLALGAKPASEPVDYGGDIVRQLAEPWPDDRVKQLIQRWEAGESASRIGKALGGVSRNAVIGKVKRLRASGTLVPRPIACAWCSTPFAEGAPDRRYYCSDECRVNGIRRSRRERNRRVRAARVDAAASSANRRQLHEAGMMSDACVTMHGIPRGRHE
jgi:hypothetical protein